MIPLQRIRDHPESIREGARVKGETAPVDEILAADHEARRLRTEVESLRARQKRESAAIHGVPTEAQRRQLGALKSQVQEWESRLANLDAQVAELLLHVPNPPDASVPVGPDESANQVVRTWGEPATFDFKPRTHYELGEALGVFDFERAVKISGSRFAVLRGDGARLQRALGTFFLDVATREHGYTELAPPYLVRREAMVGAAQLPKFEDQAYRTDDDMFLIPTAEVPLTNLHRDEILEGAALPIAYAALSPCWRREAGAAGKDTRGYIRMHQFDKVEMVRITTPERSVEELELLTGHAENLLQRLGIAYRVLLMCTADMGFAQLKKYDVEAWMPGMNRWLEVSSCSAFGDFQSRRAGIRYRSAPGERPQYVHTLNGSGLPLGRTLDAVMETYQQGNGGIGVPEVLRPYMAGQEMIAGPPHG